MHGINKNCFTMFFIEEDTHVSNNIKCHKINIIHSINQENVRAMQGRIGNN